MTVNYQKTPEMNLPARNWTFIARLERGGNCVLFSGRVESPSSIKAGRLERSREVGRLLAKCALLLLVVLDGMVIDM